MVLAGVQIKAAIKNTTDCTPDAASQMLHQLASQAWPSSSAVPGHTMPSPKPAPDCHHGSPALVQGRSIERVRPSNLCRAFFLLWSCILWVEESAVGIYT